MTQVQPDLLLEAAERAFLRKFVAKHGLAGAARLLNVSRGVVSSAAGGIAVRSGSVKLLREALTEHQRQQAAK